MTAVDLSAGQSADSTSSTTGIYDVDVAVDKLTSDEGEGHF